MTISKEGVLPPFTPGVVDYLSRGESSDEEKKERPVLGCTKEALVSLDWVYQQFLTTRLWPHNVPNETLIQAATEDPSIGSHYTIVRLEGSDLKGIPYVVEFEDKLELVAEWVYAASKATKNSGFRTYLEAVSDELIDGEPKHERAIEAWLAMKEEPIIDLVCGFTDRYGDRRFNCKFSPQGWTGKVDRVKTAVVQNHINQQILIWREVLANLVRAPDYVSRNPRIKGRYDLTERFSGLVASMKPSANNLPCEQNLRDRYGSKITIFGPSLEYNSLRSRYPLLKKIIPYEARRNWLEEDIREVSVLMICAHESSHSIIRRNRDEERLGNQFAVMNEFYATTLALAILGQREDVTDHLKNVVLGLFFASVVDTLQAHDNGDTSRDDYLPSYAIIFNSLLTRELIKVENGTIKWSNYRPIYNEFLELAKGSEAVVADGNKAMVERWRRTDGNFNNLRQLAPFQEKMPRTPMVVPD